MIEVLALDDSPTRSPIYFPRGPQLEGSDEIFDMLARAFFRRADQPIRQHARGETGTLTAEPANSGLFGTPQGGPLSPLLSNLMLDSWTRSWRRAASTSCAMPTTATSTCAVSGPVSG